jgi:hypothetical protein
MDTRSEVVQPGQLHRYAHGRVWVVNRVEIFSKPRPVPVPPSWEVLARETFREAFDAETITVLLYGTSTASGPANGRAP